MRDQKRIERIILLLDEAWKLVPDWRLGQLISNLLGAGKQDVFHPEDEVWEKLLEKFVREHRRS